MVAIVSGNSLGLNLTSKGVLGDRGIAGDPTHGQGGEQVYVNAATGNVVMQQLQDVLVGAGLDIDSVLTYNSLGQFNDDNNDNFSIGKVPMQLKLSGTVNTAGSTLTRTSFDGTQTVFNWDASHSRYVAVNGAGAFDTITYSASRYTWVDGATQLTETYDGTSGNLLTRSDTEGNSLTFGYTGQLLTSVTDANGETVTYVYSGNQLQQIKAPVTTWVGGVATTSVQPVVTYSYYAGSNFLKSVTVDLSPDGSTSDGNVYQTTFTYDGSSNRVATMQQTDGTSLTFHYDGSQRVDTITDALNNKTTFSYDTANRKTSVTANGQTTLYGYDANGQLLSVAGPAVNGVNPTTTYAYNANGQVVSRIDGDGRTTSMAYDAAGNQVSVLDGAGELTTRVFDGQNRLLTETRSLAPIPALVLSPGMAVSDGNVVKTGTALAWDSGARSVNSFTGACTVSFTATSPATNVMVGLNTDPDANASSDTIDYGLYLNGGNLAVLSNGAWITSSIGSYVTGDRLAVSYDGNGHVNFLKNGQVLYTMAGTPAQPLFVDTSFAEPGSSVANLTFASGPVDQTLINGNGMQIAAGNNVTKTASTNAWDSSVYSKAGITGPATVSVNATSAGTDSIVGLNSDPATDQSYTSIDYALHLANGTLQVFSNGVYIATVGSYVAGDSLAVSYDGSGHVNFLKSGQVLYTMAATPSQPLFVDTSFYGQGASIANLAFVGAASALTTRYVYSADGKGLLRYQISPEGRVTEYGYDAQGQLTSTIDYVAATYATAGLAAGSVPTEANMNTWRASQDLTRIERTDIARDSRQQVSSTTTYTATTTAGAGIPANAATTTFVYDPSGRLLQTIKPGSATTTYVYDGLGRTTSTKDALGHTTTTAYTDASNTIAVTYANQLVTTSIFDKDGNLLSTASAAAGTTLSKGTVDYDAAGNVLRTTDLTGASTWFLYDALNRKVATIDATGALTQYVYDSASQVTETISYAARVNTAALVDGNGKPNNPALATILPAFNATTDHRAWVVHDAAGRISQNIDATGAVTQYTYDTAGRVTAVCTYATLVNVSAFASSPGFQFVAASAADRIARSFYDGDGNLVGSLDADNFLTVYQYDGAGQRTVTIGYATKSPAATGQSTLAQMIPATSPSDRRSVTLYSSEGLVTGQVDPDGYLTQTFYNARHTVDHTTRYATSVGNAIASGSLVDSIKPAASSSDATTAYVYDSGDRVTSETDPAGVVTTYSYDANSNELLGTTVGSGRADASTTQTRYDAMGRAIAVLDGVGSALITAGMPQAQIDAVWAAHAATTSYDLAGRRTSVKDALGNVTLYFYDVAGNLRYTVDPLNNVSELRYDAFGNVTTTVQYATAISPSGIGAGGLVTTNLTAAVAAVANPAKDVVARKVYDVDGRVTLSVDPTGAATQYTYDAFGNVTQTRQLANTVPTGGVMRVDYVAGTNSSTEMNIGTFNAGDVVTVTVRFKAQPGIGGELYLGNYTAADQVSTIVAGTGGWVTMTLTHTMTTTSSMNVYLYGNRDGLNGRGPAAGDFVLYDNVRVTSTQKGVVTDQNFDPVSWGDGAALGLWLQTTGSQAYATLADAGTDDQLLSLVTSMVDSSRDRVTRNVHDADGRVTLSVDPTGAATQYTYDAFGNVTQTRQLANKVPSGGALAVTYTYGAGQAAIGLVGNLNANDTVTATVRFKAPTSQSGMVYLVNSSGTIVGSSGSVAGTGGWITLTATGSPGVAGPVYVELFAVSAGSPALYDNVQVVSTQGGVLLQDSFDQFVAGSGKGQWSGGASVQTSVDATSAGSDDQLTSFVNSIADPAHDLLTRAVHDADGRLTLSVDPTGEATAYTYDAFGNVTQTRQYANKVPSGGALAVTYTYGAGQAAIGLVGNLNANDTVTATVRFKAPTSQSGMVYLVNSSGTIVGSSGSVAGTGGWITLTATGSAGVAGPVYVELFAVSAGSPALYDNVQVVSAQGGVLLQDSFDQFVTGSGKGQWSGGASALTSVDASSAGSDDQLASFVNSIADPAHDLVTRAVHDADGRVTLNVDATGAATGYTYDAFGHVTQTRQYANKVPSGGILKVPSASSGESDAMTLLGTFTAGDVITATVRYHGDGAQQGKLYVGDGTGGGGTTLYLRSQDGWTTATVTWTVAANSTTMYAQVAAMIAGAPAALYDDLLVTSAQRGVLLSTSFDSVPMGSGVNQWFYSATQGSATPADAGSDAALLQLMNQIADPSRDLVTREVHDADGRVTLSVDATGAATQYTYDANGNVTQTRQLANAVPSGGVMRVDYVAGTNSSTQMNIGTFNTGDVVTVTVRFKAQPGVGGELYLGNYTAADQVATVVAGTGGWVTMTLTHTMTTTSSMNLYLYGNRDGLNGRGPVAGDFVLYDNVHVTSAQKGVVTDQNFDPISWGDGAAFGRWLQTTGSQAYATPADAGTDDQLLSLVGSMLDSSRDLVTRKVYDADGRVTLSVDATGAATGYTYDAFGHVTQTRQYANKVPSGGVLKVPSAPTGESDAMTLLGTFTPGDVITATVRYHGDGAQQGKLYVGDGTGGGGSTLYLRSQDGWTTATVTWTVAANSTIMYAQVAAMIAGAPAAVYDDLLVTSAQRGVLLSTSFDSVPTGNGVNQWFYSATQGYATPADAGTDGQLKTLVATLADATRDRFVNNEYDADGRLVYTADALGHAQRYVYDSMGRVAYSIAPDGSFTSNQYDADGRLVKTTTCANVVSLTGLSHVLTLSQQASLTPAPSATNSDSTTRYGYDGLGRVQFTMDGTGGLTELDYDADGNVTDQIRYANQATWATGSSPSVTADPVHDRHVHSSYDAFGRVVAQSDGTGAVVVNTYDADGRLTDRISYANRIAPGSWTSGAMPGLSADSTRDIHERFVYDALGRLAYSADGMGAVTGFVYDAHGNVTQRTAFSTAIASGQSLASVATSANDRTERFTYDAFGRQVWHADATGALDFSAYDADGRVVQTIRYAAPNTGPLPATSAALAVGASDRVSSTCYNAFGQVTYAIDALNRVTLDVYFQDGRLKSTTQYAATLAARTSPQSIAVNASADETTQYAYDAAGRVLVRTDALGATRMTYYDGLGNVVKTTDENGQSWNYVYDAVGRQVTATSPQVLVTTGTANTGANVTASVTTASVVTSTVYDRAGNAVSRTVGSSASDQRSTTMDYDADGHLVSVGGPSFSNYNAQGVLQSTTAPITRTLYDAFGNDIATIDPSNAVTWRTYDLANRLRYSGDALGFVTEQFRNAFGDVLTSTAYGNATTLSASVPASAAAVPVISGVQSALGSVGYGALRSTNFTYDNAGRQLSRTGPLGTFVNFNSGSMAVSTTSAVTVTAYDAFGDAVQSTVQDASGNVAARSFAYYDAAGQETLAVDADGYQTRTTYDNFGNVLNVVEYAAATSGSTTSAAAAVSTSATDRTTSSTFDQLNRRVSQTRNLAYDLTDDGATSGATTGVGVKTSWSYDKLGHVTSTQDAAGAVTYSEYDALGQLRALIAPARASTVDASTITPVLEYSYDAFGEQTVVTERANTATGVSEYKGTWTPSTTGYAVVGSASDRITRKAYDGAGHLVQVDDPMSGTGATHHTYSVYTIRGQLSRQWHFDAGNDGVAYAVYEGYVYDANGQTLHVYTPSTDATQLAHDISTDSTYDAFGDIVSKGITSANGSAQEFFRYNANGQLWLTNSGGVVTASLHDLQGRVVSQLTSEGTGHGNVDLSTATSEAAVAGMTGLKHTDTVYDANGNAVRTIEAARENVDGGVTSRTGTTSWSITASAATTTDQNKLTLTYPDLSGLGAGQVKFLISYTATDGTAMKMTVVTDSASAKSPFVATWYAADAITQGVYSQYPVGMASVQQVVISKKDATGNWTTISTTAAAGQTTSLSRLEIASPSDAGSKLTFSYQPQAGGATVVASLVNFGSASLLDTTSLAAGVYSYTASTRHADGSITTKSGTFTVNSNAAGTSTSALQSPVINRTFDRWGNMLSVSDPRSAQWVTTYTYNADDKVVTQKQTAASDGVDLQENTSFVSVGAISVYGLSGAKNGTTNAWDAAIRSTVSETGACSVSFDAPLAVNYNVPPTANYAFGGLNTDPDTDASYASLDYAFYMNGGSLEVWASGSRVAVVGSYVGGDRLSVTYDGVGNVVFRQNGQIVYSMAATVTQPLYFDSSFLNAGSGLSNIEFGRVQGALTQYFYDRDGREVATIDADSHKTGYQYDAAGNLMRTDDADGGHTVDRYDIFGRLAQSVTADGFNADGSARTNVADYTTAYGYDALDHLLSVQHGVGAGNVSTWTTTGVVTGTSPTLAASQVAAATNLSQVYTYDADGNRLSSWDGTMSSTQPTLRALTTYKYDAAGHLIATIQPLVAGQSVAATTTFNYDDFGHESSTRDADGNTESWTYDYFGTRLLTHKDLAGTTYSDAYDNAGQLVQQTSTAGQNLSYSYDSAGELVQIVDAALGKTTSYVYDLAGNHLVETTRQANPAGVAVVYQDNHMVYDEAGRLSQTSDESSRVVYTYDGVGNRMEANTYVIAVQNKSENVSNTEFTSDRSYGFDYDAMNRQTLFSWSSLNASDGHAMTYDYDGNRTGDSFSGRYITVTGLSVTGKDTYGNPIYSGTPTYSRSDLGVGNETYSYDADDRLTQTFYNGIFIDNRLYDAAGRIVMQGSNNDLPSGWYSALNHTVQVPDADPIPTTILDLTTRINKYDEHGQLIAQRTIDGTTTANVFDYSNKFDASNNQIQGYDAAGNLRGSFEQSWNIPNSKITTDNYTQAETITLQKAESYQRQVDKLVKTPGAGSTGGTSTSTTVLDADGHIRTVTSYNAATNPSTLVATYIEDNNGQTLDVLTGTLVGSGNDEHFLVVNGMQLGAYGFAPPPGGQAEVGPGEMVDFDFGYRPLEDRTQAGSGLYIVHQGDTLMSIAAYAYGDSRLAQKIADANGIQSDNQLRVGQTLVMPNAASGTYDAEKTHLGVDDEIVSDAGLPSFFVPEPKPRVRLSEADRQDFAGPSWMQILMSMAAGVDPWGGANNNKGPSHRVNLDIGGASFLSDSVAQPRAASDGALPGMLNMDRTYNQGRGSVENLLPAPGYTSSGAPAWAFGKDRQDPSMPEWALGRGVPGLRFSSESFSTWGVDQTKADDTRNATHALVDASMWGAADYSFADVLPLVFATSGGPQTYTVRAGDNPAKLGRQFFGDERAGFALLDSNKLDTSVRGAHSLRVGTILNIPTGIGQTDLSNGGRLIASDARIAAALNVSRTTPMDGSLLGQMSFDQYGNLSSASSPCAAYGSFQQVIGSEPLPVNYHPTPYIEVGGKRVIDWEYQGPIIVPPAPADYEPPSDFALGTMHLLAAGAYAYAAGVTSESVVGGVFFGAMALRETDKAFADFRRVFGNGDGQPLMTRGLNATIGPTATRYVNAGVDVVGMVSLFGAGAGAGAGSGGAAIENVAGAATTGETLPSWSMSLPMDGYAAQFPKWSQTQSWEAVGNSVDVLDPASSRLAQPGGLMATEGNQVARADGSLATTHPLAKHGPDVTDQYIYDRVATELLKKDGTLRPGLRTAFNDRAQMEDAIAETINLRQNDIDAWLASGPRQGVPEPFTANPGMGNLGRGYEVTTKGGPIIPISQAMPNVNLVLIPDGNGGWLIHTAHPF